MKKRLSHLLLTLVFFVTVIVLGNQALFANAATTLRIVTQPKSVTVASGKKATIKVVAKGDGLKYQWYLKDKGESAYKKSSTTKAEYSYTMTSEKSGRQVYCVVKDKYGNKVKTNTVTLKQKTTKVSIQTQPKSVTVANGKVATVKVVAKGDGLKYQWYLKSKGQTAFKKSSATKSSYSYTVTPENYGRQVYCVITDKYGNKVTTKTVRLSIKAGIKTQPKSVVVAEGKTAKAAVKAYGDGLQYQWYLKTKGQSTFKKSSAVKSSYTYTMAAENSGRQVYCVITDKYGNKVTTKTVSLSVKAKIKTQPASVVAAEDKTAKVTVKAIGEGLKYQWYFKDKDQNAFKKSSVTKSSYSYTMTSAKSGRQVYCVITDKFGNTVSTKTATLSVKLAIKAQPVSVMVEDGKTASVTVKAIGEGLKYQWYVKDKTSTAFKMTSETSAVYSCTMSRAIDGRQVYCIVTDENGSTVKTDVVTLGREIVYAYFITIDLGNGTTEKVGVEEEGAYELATPIRHGYSFEGWFDAQGNEFPASGTVSEDTTIVAKWSLADTDALEKLINCTDSGATEIKITADIVVNQPLFINDDVTIYADGDYSITRAPDYAGDIFVVGENKDGVSAIMMNKAAKLTLGGGKGTLTIDGNRDNMTVDVVGTAIYVYNSATVELYDGVCIANHKKVGNERTKELLAIGSAEALDRIGGAAIIVANGVVDMYGGIIENNEVAADTSVHEVASCGGAVYNRGSFNMYGGVIRNNKAITGGGIYNDKFVMIYAGSVDNNEAITYGGGISSSSNVEALIYVGTEGEGATASISGNKSGKAGGAIYSNTNSPVVVLGNTVMNDNYAKSIGGAIYTGGALTVRGTEFVNNFSESQGGAIYHKYSNVNADRRDLEVENCLFQGNKGLEGGAIALGAADNKEHIGTYAVIKDSVFKDNIAESADGVYGSGGAIYVSLYTELDLSGSTFENNTAKVKGGAILITGESAVTMTNNNFYGNSANYGGVMQFSSGKLSITGGVMENNTAYQGGALYLLTGEVPVKDCTFKGNTATGKGGAVYVVAGTHTFTNSTMTENNCPHGGALFIEGANTFVTLNDCSAYKNSATNGSVVNIIKGKLVVNGGSMNENAASASTSGGAIYAVTPAVVEINGTEFDGNTAGYGGAMSINGANVTISDNTVFKNNTAAVRGGAIDVTVFGGVPAALTMTGGKFENNESPTGGAVCLRANAEVAFNGTDFIGNNATDRGGAIYNAGGNLTIDGSKLNDNSAVGKAGVVYAEAGTTTIKNVTATNNSAPHGGVVFVDGASNVVTLTDSDFTGGSATNGGVANIIRGKLVVNGGKMNGNTATASGGAIYAVDPGVVEINGTEFDGNTAGYGGAMSINGAKITVSDETVFKNNSASTRGGAFDLSHFNGVASALTMTGGKFENNESPTGGVLCIRANSEATFNNTTFIGNNSSDRAGVIYNAGGKVTVNGGILNDNKAAKKGGVVYAENGTTTINNVSSSGNNAPNGGVVFMEGANTVVNLTDNKFNEYSVTGNGAVANVIGGKLVVNGGTMNNNTATSGAAIYAVAPGNVEIKDTEFDGNTSGYGGAVSINGANVTVSGNTVFKNNIATVRAGAIEMTHYNNVPATLTMIGGSFENNAAPLGGAVSLRANSEASFDGTTFTGNAATNENTANDKTIGGGAIFAYTGTKLTLKDATFAGNTSKNYGGNVMANGAANVTITGCSFTGTEATDDCDANTGAALYLLSCTTSTVKDVTITGISAKWNGAVYTSKGDATFENVTATNNKANQGGVLYLGSDNATVKNLVATGNTAADRGGVLYVGGGNITVEGGTLNGNASANKGGLVYAAGGTTTIKNVTPTDNTANHGGVLFMEGANTVVNLVDSNFNEYTAVNGGVANVIGGKLIVTGGTMNKNTASASGGAIYVGPTTATTATVEINGTEFDGNTAGYGGAMSLNGAIVTVSGDTVFKNNTATTRGGAWDVSHANNVPSEINMTGGKFESNTAPIGGALCIRANSVATFDSTTFIGNTTTDRGGVIYNAGGKVTVDGGIINDNTATNKGGVVYAENGTTTIKNVTPTGNSAKFGGAVFMEGANTVINLVDSNFNGYTATNGGVANITNGKLVVTGGTMNNNTAASCGGAIYAVDPSIVEINGTVFDGNTAGYGGGAISINGAKVTVSGNTVFKNNTATTRGGAVEMTHYNNVPGVLNMTGGSFENNVAPTGGAVYLRATNSEATFDGTTFTNNASPDANTSNSKEVGGGAIFAYTGTKLTLKDATFAGNTSKNYGGNVMANGAASITINGGSITGTEATGDYDANTGAALYFYGCKTTPTIVKDVTITGVSAQWNGAVYTSGGEVTFENITATGNSANQGTVFYLGNTATVKNLTATGNTAKTAGGVIYVSGGNVTVEGGSFTNNKATTGGVVHVASGSAAINGGSFSNNTATNGAVIYVAAGSATVNGSEITNNTASDRAGVVYTAGGNVTIDGATLNNNKADYKGGIVYAAAGTTTIKNVTPAGNSAPNGGALFIEGANTVVNLTNSNFNGYSVTGNGGVANITNGKLVVTGGTMNNNTASSGAAIYAVTPATVEINGTEFDGNTSGYGGAMSINGSVVTVSGNTVFKNNTATTRGGAVDVTVSGEAIGKLIMTDGKFFNNTSVVGGAVYLRTNAEASFNGTTFENNASTDVNTGNDKNIGGGAIFGYSGTKLTLTNVTFTANTSKNYGGHVMVNGAANVTMNGGSITGTEATDDYDGNTGAALYFLNCTTSSVKDVTISGISAQWNGAVYASGGNATFENITANGNSANQGTVFYLGNTATVKNLTATGNTAKTAGAVIYVSGGNVTVEGGSFSENTAKDGGAIYVASGSATVDGTEITKNTATGNGGVLYTAAGTTTLNNVTVAENSATLGGAIYLDGTSETSAANVTVSGNSVFDGNEAKDCGGAIYIADSTKAGTAPTTLIMNGITLKNNKAKNYGGAICTDATSSSLIIKVTDCLFEANQAGYNNTSGVGGGVAYINNGNSYSNGDPTEMKIVFKNCELKDNQATGTGGGINITGDSYVLIDGLKATGNKSTMKWNGAAVYMTSAGSRMYLTGTVSASGNTAGSKDSFMFINKGMLYTSHSNTADWVSLTGFASTNYVKYDQVMPNA